MEREYTVGGMLVLITIFVIALIVYFTVPDFNDAVKSIADDVFGFTAGEVKESMEQAARESSEEAFTNIVEAYKKLSTSELKGCTYDIELNILAEGYQIRSDERDGKLKLVLYQGRASVKEDDLPEIKQCIMSGARITEPTSIHIYNKEGLKIVHDKEYSLLDSPTPKFYKTQEGDICWITSMVENVKEQFHEEKDCMSGKKETEDLIKGKFNSFIETYKKCKTYSGTGNCKCGEFDADEIPESWGLFVSQKSMTTTFSLRNTVLREVITSNKAAEIKRSWGFWTKVVPFESEEEKIKGQKKIIFYGDKQHIYLAKPSLVSDTEKFPLCFGDVYLTFDSSITKEQYKSKMKLVLPDYKEEYFEYMYNAAEKHDIDLLMLASMTQQESRWNKDAVSYVGAAGMIQFMPETAKEMGLKVPNYEKLTVSGTTTYACSSYSKDKCDKENDERFNAQKNIEAGAKYVRRIINDLKKSDRVDLTFENIVASYNAGPGAVKKHKGFYNLIQKGWKETKGYVKNICVYYEQMKTDVCSPY
ncbi:MAG: transglycosylase SLT domain-containing protein [Nanoarchaeota archaeon]|nr:transglycosylase SLT domain-containing protein [Nanoarchaeota archaeon]MCG2718636.1 transglycosylase SLT domain-containing protein [Nanoarchaeota archaeon]